MQVSGVYILWLRDLKRYLRARSRFIGSLGMPFFFLAFFSLGFRRVDIPSLPENLSYIDFLAPGIVSMVLIFMGTLSGVSVVWDRQFGFLREIIVSPVSRTSIVLGRTLGGATIAMFQAVLILVLSTLLGFTFSIISLPFAIFAMFFLAVACTATGIALSTFIEDVHGFQIIINFFIFPIFFLSGSIFPVSELPEIVRTLSYLNPFTYGVDLLRFVLTGFSEILPAFDLFVLVVYASSVIFIASKLFSMVEVSS